MRRISPEGIIATVAGNGQAVPAGQTGGAIGYSPASPFSSGDGGPAIHATFNRVGGAIFDAAGNLYVSDSGGNRIRKIAPDGTIGTFAGTGQAGYSGDGGPALQATLFGAGPLALDPKGSLYVITGDSRVRKITTDGTIHLVAGTGTGTGLDRAQGDGGPAVNATLNEPGGVAFDAQGNTYIADTSNARLRKIDTSGIITTIVGPGQQGTDYYNAVAVDPQGQHFSGVDPCRPVPRGHYQCSLGDDPPREPRRNSHPGCGKWTAVYRRTRGHTVRLRRHARHQPLSCARFVPS